MKFNLINLPLFIMMVVTNLYAQSRTEENYQIYLNENKSARNARIPIVLEEKDKRTDVLFKMEGEEARKEVEYYKVIDDNFSLQQRP